MFLRKEECEALEKIYDNDSAELVIIYGRRRLGKTTLVLEFLKGKEGVYLYTPRGDINRIINYYADSMVKQLGIKLIGRITNFKEFLDAIYEVSSKRKVVVIIDEFQRLHEADETSMTILQDYWDRSLRKTKIKLLLVGSVVGLIERIALKGDAPLFGRRTLELKLGPLPYYRAREFWKKLDPVNRVIAYGVFGGTPAYIDTYNHDISIWENIERVIVNKNGRLNKEPEELLSEELRSPTIYIGILDRISEGRRGLPLAKIKVSNVNVIPYIRTLEKMDIIERIHPLNERKRGALYVFKDEFFRFWFRFINKNYWMIEMNRYDLVMDKIKNEINDYLSYTTEKILRELLVLYSGKELFGTKIPKFKKFGAYWDKEIEIDALGIGRDTIVVGEVKWRDEKMSLKDISKVIEKAEKIARIFNKKDYKIVLLSKKGYKQEYEEENIVFLDPIKMEQAFDMTLNP